MWLRHKVESPWHDSGTFLMKMREKVRMTRIDPVSHMIKTTEKLVNNMYQDTFATASRLCLAKGLMSVSGLRDLGGSTERDFLYPTGLAQRWSC
jgi:hypothetical protein